MKFSCSNSAIEMFLNDLTELFLSMLDDFLFPWLLLSKLCFLTSCKVFFNCLPSLLLACCTSYRFIVSNVPTFLRPGPRNRSMNTPFQNF